MSAINSVNSPLFGVNYSRRTSKLEHLFSQDPPESSSSSPGAIYPIELSAGGTGVQFLDLPLEVRDLIWEHTLPGPRLFHVDEIQAPNPSQAEHAATIAYRAREGLRMGDDRQAADLTAWTFTGRLQFFINHAPPIATRVCRESRAAALHAGFFVLPAVRKLRSGGGGGGGGGRCGRRAGPRAVCYDAWFNAHADILYLDRNQRKGGLPLSVGCYGLPPMEPGPAPAPATPTARLVISNLHRVRHVGLEWRSLLLNGSEPVRTYSNSRFLLLHWRRRLDQLYAYFPLVEALHYVMPVVRYQGGYPYGREPQPFKFLPARLTGLPDETVVPVESGHCPWSTVREELEKGFGNEEVGDYVGKAFGGKVRFPLPIEGVWLVRQGIPDLFESPSVKIFDS